MLFMKLVSFVLDVVEVGGDCRGLPQLETEKHRGEKLVVCARVEYIGDVGVV